MHSKMHCRRKKKKRNELAGGDENWLTCKAINAARKKGDCTIIANHVNLYSREEGKERNRVKVEGKGVRSG